MKALQLVTITVWLLFIQVSFLAAQSFSIHLNKATVTGTSNLHDWESTIEKLECTGSFTLANNTLKDIKDVVVKIPVKSIKSPKGKIMDSKTYEAFNYEKYPSIIFTLKTKKINDANSTIEVEGDLSMAGVTKAISMILNYKLVPSGEMQVSGAKKIIMTEFKMKPPTAMMGTIKVGNEVVVNFDLMLSMNNTL
ncbi:MAG: YceI family protein [Bacteroidia bacterium]|nr:YceI family protein [Bacteroidia bacterium]